MILLLTGASHTGKTFHAQKLMKEYNYPVLSMDLLKMGLIRSGNTTLTPMDDDKMTGYLWPIVREMIKTAIENKQNLIVEGCYIPFDWKKDFEPEYLEHIKYCCLIMSEQYIRKHFTDIKQYANVIEKRLDDSDLTEEWLIDENIKNLNMCETWQLNYCFIDCEYRVELDFK